MRQHTVRVYDSRNTPPRTELLAWKLAAVALDATPIEVDIAETISNRIIDNSAVAIAAIRHATVADARSQALAHSRLGGATVYGISTDVRVACEWAAWANSTAVRELDFHDTFLAADMNHPGDMIPALIAVGQQSGSTSKDMIRGVASAYEISIALTKSIALYPHKIDHLPHIAAGIVAGIGSMLSLPIQVIYQAINHVIHVSVTSRQSRKGQISTWKANAPAHISKLAIEAVDRAMRGGTGPEPIYEGEEGIIAVFLDGSGSEYVIDLPELGEPKRAILETFTKAHSAEIQAQPWIDIAFRLRSRVSDLSKIESVVIYTSQHTHMIIGSGSNDPQKYDPFATRETLDHSLMYIFSVALEDGYWHHEMSYSRERATRASTIELWKKVSTREDAKWTEKYHSIDLNERSFGGRIEIQLGDGHVVSGEIEVADAHPRGMKPFSTDSYVSKFNELTAPYLEEHERDRFLRAALALNSKVQPALSELNITVASEVLSGITSRNGLF